MYVGGEKCYGENEKAEAVGGTGRIGAGRSQNRVVRVACQAVPVR